MKFTATYVAAAALAAVLSSQSLPASAQGIIPGKPQLTDLSEAGFPSVAQLSLSELELTRNLLVRLGYMQEAGPERPLDAPTLNAARQFFAASGWGTGAPDKVQLFRALFSAIWVKEQWSAGKAEGQDSIVDSSEVTNAQRALTALGDDPGPIDGVFGPLTMAGVARFQVESGMKVDGLLNRNMLHNITRSEKFAQNPPSKTIHMLNWPDYVDPAALDSFERETNIRVVHETFEESGETKDLLLQGSSKYDVMVQSGQQLRQVLERTRRWN